MKKIPTLFKREFKNHKVVGISDEVTPGFEWVLEGKGIPTEKIDGACCAIINGELYKRYDAKKGKKPPEGAIPCCDPDPVTGHWPHWVKCNADDPADKWFINALHSTTIPKPDRTYEAIGPHFQNNPYNLEYDVLVPHGERELQVGRTLVGRTFEEIKSFLKDTCIEGIVFWKDGEPQCKIKRSDFGFEWGTKR